MLRTPRATLIVATIAYVLGITAQNTYLFFVAPIALAQHGAQTWGPLVFAGSALATMLAVVPAGQLADRYPRRRVMRAGLALLALAYVPVLLDASAPRGEIIASILSGTGLALLIVSFNSYVADLLAASEMSSAYGRAGAVAILGSASGPFVGALVFHLAPTPAIGLVVCCVLFGLAGVGGMLLSLALPTQARLAADDVPARPAAKSPVLAVSFLYVLVGVSFGLTTPYFAQYFLEWLSFSPESWGYLLAAGTVASAGAFLVSGALGRRFPMTKLLLGGQALAALATLPFLLPLAAVALGATYVARTFLANGFSPLINALMMSRVPASRRGVAQGWTSAAWNAGWAVGALAGGALLARWGGGAFVAGGTIGLIGAVVGVTMLRRG
ncbi:MAG: MFS transporter [Candidatus Thermoplasmatota archaeon]